MSIYFPKITKAKTIEQITLILLTKKIIKLNGKITKLIIFGILKKIKISIQYRTKIIIKTEN